MLARNLPRLRTLCARQCNLGDEGVALLLAGLSANSHLRELEWNENGTSEDFERGIVTPVLEALAARSGMP